MNRPRKETGSTIGPDFRENRSTQFRLLAILSLLMCFGGIGTNLYLPAMPMMSEALGANAGSIELTVTGYLAGFSLGQLIWGPISDRRGRRGPIFAGLVLFIIGSIGCALADSMAFIIVVRLIQAFGASACVVLARAIVRDLFEGYQAARMLSTLITIMGVIPLIAPLLGSQILLVTGWRGIFWSLTAIGVIAAAAMPLLPETLPVARRNKEHLIGAFGSYLGLVKSPLLAAYIGVSGFYYAGMFAFIAGSPLAYMSYYRVGAGLYGILYGMAVAGIMVTNMINVRLVKTQGPDRLLVIGTFFAGMVGLCIALCGFTDLGGLWVLACLLVAFTSVAGFITANSIAGALEIFPSHAGSVSALIGASQFAGGIISSGLISLYADGTPWPMSCAIAVSGIGSVACILFLKKQKKRNHL